MKTVFRLLILISVLCPLISFSQEEREKDLDNLTLEELMNIPIGSASKKEETLFDAPLSSYTITRSDIDKAGATSIVEALRLSPGIIVREQTNGIYDVHIRGFDNIMGASLETYAKSNTTTLVMIDNRPVFNHNLGGTFLETLPVDLNDVERIEIVRGPSAPLFGPNAVTGVINIITKKTPEENKSIVYASVQGGSSSTLIANASAGKNFGKFSTLISGNFQKRERFDEKYYFPITKDYHSVAELEAMLGPQIKDQYADPSLALNRFGVNANLSYKLSDDVNFNLAAGTMQSASQKIFLSNVLAGAIPFTTNETESSYINLSGKVHGLNFRSSYTPGHDNLAVAASPNQYDFDIFDATAEYAFKIGETGNIVPGMSYQNAVYGDEAYVDEGLVFLNGTTKSISTTSAFLRTDLKPLESLRILAAVRADKFSVPDDIYLAYEFAATYKLNAKHLIRAALTRSNSGSFIGYNYLNLAVPDQPQPGMTFFRKGQQDLDLLTVNMFEIGYRAQIAKNLQVDLDVFQQRAENFTLLITQPLEFPNFIQKYDNVPTTVSQRGVTFSINYIPSEKFQIKPFITAQKTEVDNLPSSHNSPAIDPTLTYIDREHKNTPAVYGGYFINYRVASKLNLNLNGYFFTSHRQYDDSDPSASDTNNIKGAFLLNAKVNWAITPQLNVFINARNVANNTRQEFFGADKIGGLYLAGASFNLN